MDVEDRFDRPDLSEEGAVYVISVAAKLAGVHPQTLRIYERKGLVRPTRTSGNIRRYSKRDIDLLRQIQEMTQEFGINLAGVKRIIEMQAELTALRARARKRPARSSRGTAMEASRSSPHSKRRVRNGSQRLAG